MTMPYEVKYVGGVTLHMVDGTGYLDCDGELVSFDMLSMVFWVTSQGPLV